MLIGLEWLIAWMVLVTDRPADSARVGPAEPALIESREGSGPAPAEAAGGIGRWLGSPAVLASALAFFSYDYVLYFFLTWLPSYLTDAYHLDLKQMSPLTLIPWACGSVGIFGGGLLSEVLYRRTGDSVLSHKIVLICGLALAAISVGLASRATSVCAAVALIACANLFLLMAPQNCCVLIQETVPSARVGAVGGFVHVLANTAGIVGPALTGFIVQYGDGYGVSFLLAGAVAVVGALGVGVFVRSGTGPTPLPRRPEADGGAPAAARQPFDNDKKSSTLDARRRPCRPSNDRGSRPASAGPCCPSSAPR